MLSVGIVAHYVALAERTKRTTDKATATMKLNAYIEQQIRIGQTEARARANVKAAITRLSKV